MNNIVFSFLLSFVSLLIISLFNFSFIYNPAVSSKEIIFLFYCCAIIIALLCFFAKTKKISLSYTDLFFLLLCFYISANSSSYKLKTIGICLFYILGRLVFSNIHRQISVIISISLVLFVNLVYGILQYSEILTTYNSNFPITGSFFNPAPYAGFIALGSVFLLYDILHRKKIYSFFRLYSSAKCSKKLTIFVVYFALLSFILTIFVLFISKSRAGLLAFVLSNLFFYASYKKLFKIKYFLFILPTFVLSLVGLYFVKKDSANGRLLIWKISANILPDNFFTGIGTEQFKAKYMLYQADYFSKKLVQDEFILADNIVYTFNDLFQFILEQGFIGILLLLLLVCSISKTNKNSLNLLGISILFCFSLFGLFSYPTQIIPIELIAVLGLIFSAFKQKNKFAIKNHKIFKIIGCIAFLSLFLYFCISCKNKLHAYTQWKKAENLYYQENFTQTINVFKEIYPILKSDGEFLMHYGKTLSLDNQYQKSNNILENATKYINNTVIQTTYGDNYKSLKQYNKAEKHYRLACNMVPNRLYPKYLLVKLYQESNQLNKALKEASSLLSVPVKVPSYTTFQIREEMQKFIYEKNN